MGGGLNRQGGLITFTDGGRTGDVAEDNRRSVHGNINTLGSRGGAVADRCGGGNYIRGVFHGIDGNLVARRLVVPSVCNLAVGAVSNGRNGQCGAAALADGSVAGDVAEGDRRSDNGQGHAHDTVATVGGGIFHQFGAGLCENGVSMLRVEMVGQLVVAACHRHLVGDGRCRADGNGRRTNAAHVVGHRHGVLAGGELADTGAS